MTCSEPCPKCGVGKCRKNKDHSIHAGIAGDCWCVSCKAWWIKGESTLLRERNQKRKP